ncbi:MAG: hypothetical protein KatS3mg004_2484 [Bryobacteraceae bacterium]|nr:MAG: hypothetical protein KatS3mg004_2484 [Bryobacteraceae bacterium]
MKARHAAARLALLCTAWLSLTGQTPPPQAFIKNRSLTARIYLPDPVHGYYRGTRFDWSGQIFSLRTLRHEYFGQWFERYDPLNHDSIMGPVEEFRTGNSAPGYDEAPAGGEFVRIGVGILRKPANEPFQTFRTYEIVDPGVWRVRQGKTWVDFQHSIRPANGYAYVYRKTVRLVKQQPKMEIEHTLLNTGMKTIETLQYNHNFFVIDGLPAGPGVHVEFPFDLEPVRPFSADFVRNAGKRIEIVGEIPEGASAIGEFRGFSADPRDYDIRVEHAAAGAGVRIRGSLPLERLVFWCMRRTFCPEPYVKLTVPPGRRVSWKLTYEFYDLQPPAGKDGKRGGGGTR